MITSVVRVALVTLAALAVGTWARPESRAHRVAGEAGPRAARSLAAGERAVERLTVPGDHLIEIVVAQLQGDVAVVLRSSDGAVVAQSDLPGKPWLEEYVAAIVEDPGSFELEIRAVGDAARFRLHHPLIRVRRAEDEVLLDVVAAWNRARELRDLQNEESTQEALGLLAEAAARLRALREPVLLGRVLKDLGIAYQSLGRVEEAETVFAEGIATFEGTGHDVLLSEMLNYRADTLVNRGRGDEAEPLYQRALGLAREAADPRIEALTWNNLGVLYYHRGELERVVEALERALRLQTDHGIDHERADTIGNLGSVYRAMGRYGDALRMSELALELIRRLDDKGRELGVLNSRGVWLKAVGRLREAADAYQQALSLVDLLGDREMEATVAGNLGSLYRLLGHEDRAREYLERALQAARQTGSASDESWALLALGELAREAGEVATATEYYAQAGQRSESAGDLLSSAHSLLGLGRTLLNAGKPSEAAETLREASRLQVQISDRPGQVATLRELGRALAQLGERSAALDYFARSLDLAVLVGEPSKEAETRLRLAEFLLRDGDLPRARAEAESALATVEGLRRDLVEPDLRAGLLSRSQEDFALLVDILLRMEAMEPGRGHAETAFTVAERMRARTLIELLAEARLDLMASMPDALRTRHEDVTGRLSRAQRDLTRALRAERLDAERLASLKTEIRDLNRQREEVEREVRLADSRWGALEYPSPIGLEGARRLLAGNQALLSFVLGPERSYVFVVTPHGFVARPLPAEAELAPRVEALRRYLEVPSRRSLGRLTAASAELYELLLRPVEREIAPFDHLLIAPDGALHYLPFEALVVFSPVSGLESYLISHWGVSYIPSASTIDVLATRERRPAAEDRLQLVAFADPYIEGAAPPQGGERVLRGLGEAESWRWDALRGARHEVEEIATLFDDVRTKVFVGSDASEDRFRADASVRLARYVHVASHAVIDNKQPALSAILLAVDAGSDEDGLLQTHEVFGLQLTADLVVLSACETALGRPVRGEGLVGLTRAFLSAGASTVSVSLWPVEDDATSQLMTSFYGELQKGAPMAEALRLAKLRLAREPATSNPYYWASFVLVGSPATASVLGYDRGSSSSQISP